MVKEFFQDMAALKADPQLKSNIYAAIAAALILAMLGAFLYYSPAEPIDSQGNQLLVVPDNRER